MRSQTEALCQTLAPEDFVIQAMPDVSPTKWHLAHVTWLFETFLLKPFLPSYQPLDPRYEYLFNSYYNSIGPQFSRPQRGHLSRPTVAEVFAYRAHVDRAMADLLDTATVAEFADRVELGLHHEQQHPELILTDIKYNFWVNPLRPALRDQPLPSAFAPLPLHWPRFNGEIVPIGHNGAGDPLHFDPEYEHVTAMEYLLGAMGADLVGGLRLLTRRQGLQVDDVEVILSGSLNNPLTYLGVVGEEGHPGLERVAATVYVSSIESEERIRLAWDEVLKRSPLVNTLRSAVSLDLTLRVVI